MNRDYSKINNDIRNNGFFSEYLPPCFKLNKQIFTIKIPQKSDLIKPYCFSMSRFNKNDSRREIYIPEIVSYIALNNFIEKNNIIQQFIEFTESANHSFSPIVWSDNTLVRHEQCYFLEKSQLQQKKSHYIDNIIEKIVRSKGAKKVVKLDIANCFSSIYTHIIPAIFLGYEHAQEEYIKTKNKESKIDSKYILFSELDKIIRQQNLNQTNGILVGPLYSQIIAEGLLTRIDKELDLLKINFCRYVDDYEVFIYDNNEKKEISKISTILRKYGFTLNAEKTEIIEFPYYIITNLNQIIEKYRGTHTTNSENSIELFNKFFQLEKNGVKGAIRFLLKTIEQNNISFDNHELYRAYLFSILQNDERALIKSCSLLIKDNLECPINEEEIKLINKLLKNHIQEEHDLEVIWLLYLFIKTDSINSIASSVKEEILNSNNELAQIMLLRNKILDSKEIELLKEKAKSWILIYELYASNIILEIEFINKLKLDKSLDFYKKIKEQDIHFCKL